MKVKPRFYLVGLAVAFLEEFITQGILKRNLADWIIPALIAFLPFLIAVRQIGNVLQGRMIESNATTSYYVISGVIGLMIEWLVIGLSTWSNPASDPLLTIIFQLGIFSFWGSVAFAPRLLLDRRDSIARVRRWYKRFLASGLYRSTSPRSWLQGTQNSSLVSSQSWRLHSAKPILFQVHSRAWKNNQIHRFGAVYSAPK